eukprot:CAMPEP_0116890906 /NCGR_PEP_ID=MMETSP0467-20121206/1398_1 /TAXON_ID=283647 /ORGANISM="Mesodinium pulex, Strain SPMC105" /LENGTH=144 /DNA_ID=CAMNT_0004559041 /DNA_START=74 /DNA_END=508 /DNA_ORIENTATION=-
MVFDGLVEFNEFNFGSFDVAALVEFLRIAFLLDHSFIDGIHDTLHAISGLDLSRVVAQDETHFHSLLGLLVKLSNALALAVDDLDSVDQGFAAETVLPLLGRWAVLFALLLAPVGLTLRIALQVDRAAVSCNRVFGEVLVFQFV